MILSPSRRARSLRAEPKRAFLLGTNISKSISPFIQNAAFHKLGINARYELKELSRKKLGDFVSSISKSRDTLGFNVTSPFKEDVINFLSSIDSLSKSIGAVNTVGISKTRGMRGFNTDYDGIIASLRKLGALESSRRKKKAVVIGAGGVSRACVFALLDSDYPNVTILNRTVQKAELISSQFEIQFPKSKIEVSPLTKESLSKSFENSGVIINAISNSNSKYFPVDLDFSIADRDTRIFDLGYKEDSLFLTLARKNGFYVMNGVLMLVVQAAKSFEIWTGKKAPLTTMMTAAKKALKKSIRLE